MTVERGAVFPSATAIADINGFMKYASLAGEMSVRNPWDLSSSETTGPTDAIGVRVRPSRNRASYPCACATSTRRRTWPELVSAIADVRADEDSESEDENIPVTVFYLKQRVEG